MSESAIDNALARRKELVEKIARAERVIAGARAELFEVNGFIKRWQKWSGSSVDE